MILSDDSVEPLQEVINTNLSGVLHCTKAAYKHMKKYDSIGHIININSIYGHGVPKFVDFPAVNIYPGTKHAMTATTEVIRQELNYLKNNKVKITVSNINKKYITPIYTFYTLYGNFGFRASVQEW